jgi:hypothetical protein
MTDKEQTIIRVAGLIVHALGLVVLLVGIGQGSGPGMAIGVIMFAVGGLWGWGMVVAASRRDAQERADARADAMARERRGGAGAAFSTRFDDEVEPPAPLGPPPGHVLGGA